MNTIIKIFNWKIRTFFRNSQKLALIFPSTVNRAATVTGEKKTKRKKTIYLLSPVS